MAVLLYRQAKASTWFAPLLFLLLGRSLEAKGGEKPTLKLTPFAPTEINYRQDFCTEYKAAVDVENGTFHIENALSGKQLNVVLQYGKIGFPYFNYTDEDGIDPDHPGIVAELLDYVAERGNFTWRDSFGVYSQSDLNYNDGSGVNKTWDDMIVWSAEHYDLSVDKWAKAADRLAMGVNYCEPWFDASYILVDKVERPTKTTIAYANFLDPFDNEVWYVVLGTIFFSALVHQFIEYMYQGQEGRSFRRWFMDNLYSSFLGFTQNFNYEPPSLAGRIYAFSFAFWAMLMGATYTANLAAHYVDRPVPVPLLRDIEHAQEKGGKFCTHDKSASDDHIRERYEEIDRLGKGFPVDMYDALNNGTCNLLVGTKQEYDEFKLLQDYNPNCELFEVSTQIKEVDASFVTRLDPGVKCSGLVNEVFTYYLSEMKAYGEFDKKWNKYYRNRMQEENDPNFSTCGNLPKVTDDEGRRLTSSTNTDFTRMLRGLKTTAAVFTEVDGAEGDEEINKLSIQQMAGTFLCHLLLSILAIGCALASRFEHKRNTSRHSGKDCSYTRDASLKTQVRVVRLQAKLDSMASQMDSLSNQMEMMKSKFDGELCNQMEMVLSKLDRICGEETVEFESAGEKNYQTSVELIYSKTIENTVENSADP